MQTLAARYLSLVGMMSTVAWFFWNPDGWKFEWEPIVVFLLALSGYLVSDYYGASNNEHEQVSGHDLELYKKLVSELPINGAMRMLKEHDFLGSFELNEIRDFNKFTYNWDNTEHEFIDSELEKLRSKFLSKVGEFNLAIAKYTSPNKACLQAVRVDSQMHDPEHEARFAKEAKIINDTASEAYDLHQNLIRACKKRLPV